MALETGTYLADLNPANPPGTDPKAQGDDHIRLIKTVAQNSFAGFPGAVAVTGSEAQGATANDYVVTVSPVPAAYSTAMLVVFKATHANTGAATLAVNGLAATTLKAVDASGLEAGDIESGAVVGAFYDGTSFLLVTANDRAARAGDSYTGTHDFTGATLEAATQTVGDNSTKVATTGYADANFGRITGQTWSGSQAFTGATITVPTQTATDNSTKAASTAFVQQVGFSAALPNQGGNSGKFLMTDGSTASWGNILNLTLSKSADYAVATTDRYTAFDLTGTHTLALPAAATAGDGFIVYARNVGAGIWTVDPNGSETVITEDGTARAVTRLYPGEYGALLCTGSGWRILGRARGPVLINQTVVGSPVAAVVFETGFDDAEMQRFELYAVDWTTVGSDTFAFNTKKSGSYNIAITVGSGDSISAFAAVPMPASAHTVVSGYGNAGNTYTSNVTAIDGPITGIEAISGANTTGGTFSFYGYRR